MTSSCNIRRERITWMRHGPNGLSRISHPWQWIVTEPDGYERCFDTKAKAEEWIAWYEGEVARS